MTNIADIPPDLVNPGAVELVLDIRREYAIKLEQVILPCHNCKRRWGYMNQDCLVMLGNWYIA